MNTIQLSSLSLLLLIACEGPLVEKSSYTIHQPTDTEEQEAPADEQDTDGILSEESQEDTELPSLEEDLVTSGIEVSTLAGSGEYGSTDGRENQASFSTPRAIRLRDDGSLIVIDAGSAEIRAIDLNDNVTTLTLSGEVPMHPTGLAISPQGIIYISDAQQHCIFRIEEQVSEVYAGTCGVSGNIDGEISEALFYQPTGLALKPDGALYVADSANNLIRMIDPKGNVNTIAGTGEAQEKPSTGEALEANIYLPSSIAIHSSGDIYFSGFDHCIRRIQNGYVENIAGLCDNRLNTGEADGDAEDARFHTPTDLIFTADEALIIADSFNNKIRKISANLRTVSTIAGSVRGFQDGDSKESQFNIPHSITVDDQGQIYVADSKNNRIRVITLD